MTQKKTYLVPITPAEAYDVMLEKGEVTIRLEPSALANYQRRLAAARQKAGDDRRISKRELRPGEYRFSFTGATALMVVEAQNAKA